MVLQWRSAVLRICCQPMCDLGDLLVELGEEIAVAVSVKDLLVYD